MSVFKRWNGEAWETIGPGIKNTASVIPNDSEAPGAYVGDALSNLKNDLDTLNEGGLVIKDEIIERDINNWLDEHPEATTTVEDESLTAKKMSDQLKNSLIHNIFIDNLVLDGTTDNTQTIINALSSISSGIFVIPYNCKCNRNDIISNLNYNIMIIDPYYQVSNGGYIAKYFKLLTAKNYPNNDSVIVIEDFHHPCLAINNEEIENMNVPRHATLGFANGYTEDGFLNFSFMISQGFANNTYQLGVRRMKRYDGTPIDQTAILLDELGKVGFNGSSNDYDYVFEATDRTQDKKTTLVNINNKNGGRASLNLNNGNDTQRLNIYTDSTLKGGISYGNGQQIVFPDENSITFDTNYKIAWHTISGTSPTASKGLYFVINNASPTVMNNFTSSSNIITFLFANNNTTLKQGSFYMKGSLDWTPTRYSTITFIKNTSLTNAWIELSRNEM